ncbi:hypothetical protein ACIBQ2_26000 [Micromonospora sediminimaris]
MTPDELSATRLEALRRSARNGHAGALIALGRYPEAVGDLTRQAG